MQELEGGRREGGTVELGEGEANMEEIPEVLVWGRMGRIRGITMETVSEDVLRAMKNIRVKEITLDTTMDYPFGDRRFQLMSPSLDS